MTPKTSHCCVLPRGQGGGGGGGGGGEYTEDPRKNSCECGEGHIENACEIPMQNFVLHRWLYLFWWLKNNKRF